MKQQRMMQAQQAMQANKKDGVPTFKVFTRPKAGGLWIPCGDLMGDERATALCNAWMSGFMQDMYKNQLDQGIAKSLFSQGDQFVQNLLDNYKPCKSKAMTSFLFFVRSIISNPYFFLLLSPSVTQKL